MNVFQSKYSADEIEKLLDKVKANYPDNPEYGCRWQVGQSNPTGERIIKMNGVIQSWNINCPIHDKYAGTDGTYDPFEEIDIFKTVFFSDVNGNKFRRFARFYYKEETKDGYDYLWVCKEQKEGYVLPQAFRMNGVEWNYVDSGVYMGSVEGGKLVSKPNMTPAHNITRTQAFNYAKANTRAEGDREYYAITTLSEQSEIWSVLVRIKGDTRGTQTIYQGQNARLSNSTNDAPINGISNDRLKIYTTRNCDNGVGFGYGYRCIATHTATSDQTNNDYYFKVMNIRKFVSDGSEFSGASSGTTYWELTLDRALASGYAPTYWGERPMITGATDVLISNDGTIRNNNYGSFKMLGIENMWASMWQHCLNLTIKAYKPYMCENLTAWSDTSTPENAGWKEANFSVLQTSSQYVKEMTRDGAIFLPTLGGASSSTYYSDYYYVAGGTQTAYFGGHLYSGDNAGLFYWNLGNGLGLSHWSLGARCSHFSL